MMPSNTFTPGGGTGLTTVTGPDMNRDGIPDVLQQGVMPTMPGGMMPTNGYAYAPNTSQAVPTMPGGMMPTMPGGMMPGGYTTITGPDMNRDGIPDVLQQRGMMPTGGYAYAPGTGQVVPTMP